MSINPNLVINFTDPKASSAAEAWWLRMEQEKIKKDTATISEAAGLIDTLFDIDPCNPEQEQSGGEEQPVDDRGEITPPVEEGEFNQMVADIFPSLSCDLDAAGTYETIIRVYKSHRNEPYKLVVKNGGVVQTIHVEEQVEVSVTVKDASSVDFKMPVIGGFSASWNGSVFDQNGAGTGPEMTLAGSTLNFRKKVTGRVQAFFMTEYDRVTVSIKGDAEGKPQEGNILAFYHAMVFELTTEVPEVDEDFNTPCPRDQWQVSCDDDHVCYQVEKHYSLCHCNGNRVNEYTTEPVEITCPDDWCYGWAGMQDIFYKEILDGYVDCDDPDEGVASGSGSKYLVHDPEYYEDKCCYSPDFPLPQCLEYTSKHPGGVGIDKEFYKNLYGPHTQFVAVKPEDGDCGTITIKQFVLPANCCDVATPIVWDEENSVEVIADNSSGLVEVTGGVPPYTWSVRGNGFYLDHAHTLRDGITTVPYAWIFTDDACGACTVTVTDGCSVANTSVRSTNGNWLEDESLANTCPFSAPKSEWEDIGYGEYRKIEGNRRVIQFLYVQETGWYCDYIGNLYPLCPSNGAPEWPPCNHDPGAVCMPDPCPNPGFGFAEDCQIPGEYTDGCCSWDFPCHCGLPEQDDKILCNRRTVDGTTIIYKWVC